MNKECKVEGCGRAKDTRGYCSTHYMRFLRGSPPMDTPIKGQTSRYAKNPQCSAIGCRDKSRYNQLCPFHYQRHKRGKDLYAPRYHRSRQVCIVKDCDRTSVGQSLCMAHYKRKQRGMDLDKPIKQYGSTKN